MTTYDIRARMETGAQAGEAHALTLEAKIAALKQPRTYPDSPGNIRTVETHMSWVFLTETRAYKLKKPVRYDYLDFSTLEARERDCREELRLNQRLAPGVYMGVVPLARVASGELRLEGEGAVVEWLVKMRRLPAERMLDRLIKRRAIKEADVLRLARVLIAFYRECPTVALSGADYRKQYRRMIELNRTVLASPEYRLPPALVADVHAALVASLKRMAGVFDRRARDGCIVEGHGDLRPEHVCLEARPVVFDCLEFNRQFRILDVADELSYLAMECEYLGAPFVGPTLFDAYEKATGHEPPPALRSFYMAYRACLRARLAVLHTAELAPPAWEKWLDNALRYLRLAERYCRSLKP